MDKAGQNEEWQSKVKTLLLDGLGVDDIALKLGCKVEDVRDEFGILRASGEMKKMFGNKGEL